MIVLLHDIEKISTKAIEYFGKFKELKLVSVKDSDDFLRKFWKETKTIIDSTGTHDFYKKCSKNQEEKLFNKETKFVNFKDRKIVETYTLKNYFYKKDNFNEEDFEQILHKRKIINQILNNICSSFQNDLEKELSKFSKPINIKEITLDKKDLYFVKELKDGEIAGENILDIKDFEILKELKDILLYKI